jgi:hypothetical protein
MRALMRIKMGARESPSVLFTQICTLQNRFGVYDNDEKQIIAITVALPTEYKVVLASEKRVHGGVLDLYDVEQCLEDYYRQVYEGNDKNIVHKTEDKELTLSAVTTNNRMKCWTCSKVGHSKKECAEGSN